MTSLLPANGLHSVFVCAWLIRFLFGWQSQFLLDPSDRTGWFLGDSEAQITSHYQQQNTRKHKERAGFPVALIYSSILSVGILLFSQNPCNIQDSLSLDWSVTQTVAVWQDMYNCVGLCVEACVVSLCGWQPSQSVCDSMCAVCVQMSLQYLISSGMHSIMRWPAGVWFCCNHEPPRHIDKLVMEYMGTIHLFCSVELPILVLPCPLLLSIAGTPVMPECWGCPQVSS